MKGSRGSILVIGPQCGGVAAYRPTIGRRLREWRARATVMAEAERRCLLHLGEGDREK